MRHCFLVLVVCCGCAAPVPSASRTVQEFITAVQASDFDRLRCLTAAAPEAGFEHWALSRYEAYLDGRDAGSVELDGSGIALVKLLALGRGTFNRLGPELSSAGGGRTIDGEIRLGYAHVDVSRFTPGTVIYFAASPPGRVRQLRVPAGSREISLDVLDRVTLSWNLTRHEAADCAPGWAVASVHMNEESIGTTDVTWVF